MTTPRRYRRRWYERYGIERPFPWLILAWPILWLWGTYSEYQQPEEVPADD